MNSLDSMLYCIAFINIKGVSVPVWFPQLWKLRECLQWWLS